METPDLTSPVSGSWQFIELERTGALQKAQSLCVKYSFYRNPLDWFLDTDERDEAGLTFLARRFAAAPFDADSFRTELVAKLKKLKYRSGRLTEELFYEILKHSGALDTLLRPDTLLELWKCVLLKKIVQGARELERSHKAVDGQRLQDLRKAERQLYKDLLSIDEIAQRNAVREEAENLCEELGRKYRNCVRLLLISTRYKGSRAALLSGRMRDELGCTPRDEDVATKVAIYLTLQQKVKTKATKTQSLSDIFLCQLAELICASSNVTSLSDGQAVYRAVRRRTLT